MSEWMQYVTRSVVAITTLFIFTKIMGRKELAQMNIFDYVIGISIGAIGAQMAFDLSEDWHDFLIVLIVYVGIHKLITYSTLKSMWARKFFEGAPIIIMEDGKIIEKNLRRVHYDINTFLQECRLAGYFDLGDIHTAIMESSGEVSFIRQEDTPDKQEHLVANIVIDGHIMRRNIAALKKDEQWVLEQLKKERTDVKEVLLATYNHKKEFVVYLKKEQINIMHILE